MKRLGRWITYRRRLWSSRRYWSQFEREGRTVTEQHEFVRRHLNPNPSRLWTS